MAADPEAVAKASGSDRGSGGPPRALQPFVSIMTLHRLALYSSLALL